MLAYHPTHHRAHRRGARLLIALLALLGWSFGARAQSVAPSLAGEGPLELHATRAWTLVFPGAPGDPFDVLATAEFTHVPSGASVATELFYRGDETWEFRFTPTLTGAWRFETRSDAAPLDGFTGRVEVVPSDRPGVLTTRGARFATTADGELIGALHHTYHAFTGSDLADYTGDPDAVRGRVSATLDAVEAQGFRGFFLTLFHSVFELGVYGWDEHDRVRPDLAAFEVLDRILVEAHARGMTVHLWMWGDARRNWTPRGLPGGVNGTVDRRLQRYIAARLGPLPGWTMAYGFDLEEWAGEDDVRSWAAYLNARFQLPHPLTAREENPRGGFDLGSDKLAIYSVDDRPHETPDRSCYALATARLDDQEGAAPLPVLFERRFVHQRDDFWAPERTRRCLWQLTLAGGVASVWGEPFDEALPYPDPTPFRAFHGFWEGRFRLDFARVEGGTPETGLTLRTSDGRHAVVYREASDLIPLGPAALETALPAVVLDTVSGERIEIGEIAPGTESWRAPRISDWAVALGSF